MLSSSRRDFGARTVEQSIAPLFKLFIDDPEALRPLINRQLIDDPCKILTQFRIGGLPSATQCTGTAGGISRGKYSRKNSYVFHLSSSTAISSALSPAKSLTPCAANLERFAARTVSPRLGTKISIACSRQN